MFKINTPKPDSDSPDNSPRPEEALPTGALEAVQSQTHVSAETVQEYPEVEPDMSAENALDASEGEDILIQVEVVSLEKNGKIVVSIGPDYNTYDSHTRANPRVNHTLVLPPEIQDPSRLDTTKQVILAIASALHLSMEKELHSSEQIHSGLAKISAMRGSFGKQFRKGFPNSEVFKSVVRKLSQECIGVARHHETGEVLSYIEALQKIAKQSKTTLQKDISPEQLGKCIRPIFREIARIEESFSLSRSTRRQYDSFTESLQEAKTNNFHNIKEWCMKNIVADIKKASKVQGDTSHQSRKEKTDQKLRILQECLETVESQLSSEDKNLFVQRYAEPLMREVQFVQGVSQEEYFQGILQGTKHLLEETRKISFDVNRGREQFKSIRTSAKLLEQQGRILGTDQRAEITAKLDEVESALTSIVTEPLGIQLQKLNEKHLIKTIKGRDPADFKDFRAKVSSHIGALKKMGEDVRKLDPNHPIVQAIQDEQIRQESRLFTSFVDEMTLLREDLESDLSQIDTKTNVDAWMSQISTISEKYVTKIRSLVGKIQRAPFTSISKNKIASEMDAFKTHVSLQFYEFLKKQIYAISDLQQKQLQEGSPLQLTTSQSQVDLSSLEAEFSGKNIPDRLRHMIERLGDIKNEKRLTVDPEVLQSLCKGTGNEIEIQATRAMLMERNSQISSHIAVLEKNLEEIPKLMRSVSHYSEVYEQTRDSLMKERGECREIYDSMDQDFSRNIDAISALLEKLESIDAEKSDIKALLKDHQKHLNMILVQGKELITKRRGAVRSQARSALDQMVSLLNQKALQRDTLQEQLSDWQELSSGFRKVERDMNNFLKKLLQWLQECQGNLSALEVKMKSENIELSDAFFPSEASLPDTSSPAKKQAPRKSIPLTPRQNSVDRRQEERLHKTLFLWAKEMTDVWDRADIVKNGARETRSNGRENDIFVLGNPLGDQAHFDKSMKMKILPNGFQRKFIIGSDHNLLTLALAIYEGKNSLGRDLMSLLDTKGGYSVLQTIYENFGPSEDRDSVLNFNISQKSDRIKFLEAFLRSRSCILKNMGISPFKTIVSHSAVIGMIDDTLVLNGPCTKDILEFLQLFPESTLADVVRSINKCYANVFQEGMVFEGMSSSSISREKVIEKIDAGVGQEHPFQLPTCDQGGGIQKTNFEFWEWSLEKFEREMHRLYQNKITHAYIRKPDDITLDEFIKTLEDQLEITISRGEIVEAIGNARSGKKGNGHPIKRIPIPLRVIGGLKEFQKSRKWNLTDQIEVRANNNHVFTDFFCSDKYPQYFPQEVLWAENELSNEERTQLKLFWEIQDTFFGPKKRITPPTKNQLQRLQQIGINTIVTPETIYVLDDQDEEGTISPKQVHREDKGDIMRIFQDGSIAFETLQEKPPKESIRDRLLNAIPAGVADTLKSRLPGLNSPSHSEEGELVEHLDFVVGDDSSVESPAGMRDAISTLFRGHRRGLSVQDLKPLGDNNKD